MLRAQTWPGSLPEPTQLPVLDLQAVRIRRHHLADQLRLGGQRLPRHHGQRAHAQPSKQ